MITASLLESAIGARRDLAELYAPHLDAACEAYQINTPLRLAHFLAQVGHESGSLVHSREVWGPTPAQERYEGRADLGNTQAGDGRRYMGRGLLQTTGRFNYGALRDRLRTHGIDAPDFVAAPELLEQPKWAVLSACDYWEMRGINRMADGDDHEAVTRAVNGGTNGIEDRRRRLERAKAVLAAVDTTAPEPAPVPTGDPTQYSQEAGMPIPALVGALLPAVIEAIPKLGALFKGSGSEVAQRNMAAATTVLEIVQGATKTANAQAAVEAIQASPAAREAAKAALEERWFELSEAGGGGIAAARAADQAAMNNEGPWWQVVRSPSFMFLLLAMPTVWAIVGSIVGLWGQEWPSDVRAAIATAVVSLVIGGAAGYYWGQTTSRNRAPAAS